MTIRLRLMHASTHVVNGQDKDFFLRRNGLLCSCTGQCLGQGSRKYSPWHHIGDTREGDWDHHTGVSLRSGTTRATEEGSFAGGGEHNAGKQDHANAHARGGNKKGGKGKKGGKN